MPRLTQREWLAIEHALSRTLAEDHDALTHDEDADLAALATAHRKVSARTRTTTP